jgi:molybdopterin/thiamine biosynthesis adenylyltransferase
MMNLHLIQSIQSGSFMIDFWRQLDLFSPEKFGNKEVNIVGCGATGSYTAFLLAKIGVQNLHLWDFDIVEPHNLPNQIFRTKDVGKSKVEALAEIIEEIGVKPTAHYAMVDSATELKGIVFLLIDDMDIRKNIWDGAIKFKLAVDLMIETRMAIDNGRVYAIQPCIPSDINLWENSLYSSEEAEESVCTNRVISPTVTFISSLAVWKLIKWFNKEDMEKELIFSCRPTLILN